MEWKDGSNDARTRTLELRSRMDRSSRRLRNMEVTMNVRQVDYIITNIENAIILAALTLAAYAWWIS